MPRLSKSDWPARNISSRNGQYARAVTVLGPLFAKPPERWEPWFWLGTAQLGLGQWEKSQASFVEGLARDATVPQLWVQRALVSQQQGRFGEALDALRQAELLAPRLPEVQLNLGYALEVAGDRLIAVTHYRTFLSLTEGKKAYHATRKEGAGPHQSLKQNAGRVSGA